LGEQGVRAAKWQEAVSEDAWHGMALLLTRNLIVGELSDLIGLLDLPVESKPHYKCADVLSWRVYR